METNEKMRKLLVDEGISEESAGAFITNFKLGSEEEVKLLTNIHSKMRDLCDSM